MSEAKKLHLVKPGADTAGRVDDAHVVLLGLSAASVRATPPAADADQATVDVLLNAIRAFPEIILAVAIFIPIAGLGPVMVAVDDAGAGYASLRHILEVRPTYAKLDISLVRGIERDKLRQALVAGLEYFALKSRCQLIAEGIETSEEEITLRRLGVQLGQGYLLGRPQPVAHAADAP